MTTTTPTPATAGKVCAPWPVFLAWPLPPDPTAPATARRLVRAVLAHTGGDTAVTANAELATSELTTNALQHAQPPYELRLRLTERAVVCEVFDTGLVSILSDQMPTGTGLPVLDTVEDGQAEHGRGLALVRRLADGRLGAHLDNGCITPALIPGKTVWCVLRLLVAHAYPHSPGQAEKNR